MRVRFAFAVAAILSVTTHALAQSPSGPSYPPDDPLGDLVKKGLALREQGKDLEALAVFRQAYALVPMPKVLVQVALAEQALGMWRDADRDLARAMKDGEDDDWVKHYHDELAKAQQTINTHLGTLEILTNDPNAELFIDGASFGKTAASPFRVEAGTHNVEVRAHGSYSASRSVVIPADGFARETVALTPMADASSMFISPGAPRERQIDEHPGATQRSIGWVFLATSAALAVTGAVGIVARNVEIGSYNDDGSCPGLRSLDQPPLCQAKISTAQTWSTISILGFVSSGVIAAGGFVLVLTAPKDTSQRSAPRAVCVPLLGISCIGSF